MQSKSRRRGAVRGALALALACAGGVPSGAEARDADNGFDLTDSEVARHQIRHGGVGRDAIPALDHPPHTDVASTWDDGERVLGVSWEGEARAYPLALLVWHELVNDTLGGRAILVSYCPLCGTGLVFDRRVGGAAPPRRFGVSGLLYRSDLLMYDRETESLWSQIAARALTGPSRGARLALLRSTHTSWGRWREAHPATTVLVRETGGPPRPYGSDPYRGYAKSVQLMFPVAYRRDRHPKTPTLGLRLASGAARAYPADVVEAAGGAIAESFGGHCVRVAWDADAALFAVEAPAAVEVVEGFWFAWTAFHPDTSVTSADGEAGRCAPGVGSVRPSAARAGGADEAPEPGDRAR